MVTLFQQEVNYFLFIMKKKMVIKKYVSHNLRCKVVLNRHADNEVFH
nr:MAG TPA: hypothetical protein [Caudoviricetes sp.]